MKAEIEKPPKKGKAMTILTQMIAVAATVLPQKTKKKSPIPIKCGNRNKICSGCGHKNKKCTCQALKGGKNERPSD